MSSVLAVPDLLEVLRRHALVEPAHLGELAAIRGANPQALGKVILERGWLTPFQVNRILNGKVQELILGQYLLQAKLGAGGMGEVFRALDRTMNRLVALKLIRPDMLDSEQAVARFLKEIRAAASLDHPNIVRAYHASPHGSSYYLVMELVNGADLGKRLKEEQPLPIASVCDWGRQTALALQHLAERGLVHRDVKPMNLLLSAEGIVKLLDMGLARVCSLEALGASAIATVSGSMMGTPDYVAPEQITDAANVDSRADIYSLGCTLYHLLAGRPPFVVKGIPEKLRCHLVEQPERLERLRADVPPELAELVRRMMRKKPEDRPQTPAEVGAALESIAGFVPPALAGPTPPALSAPDPLASTLEYHRAPGRRSWPRWALAAGALALVVVLLLLWNPFRGAKDRSGTEQGTNPAEEIARNEGPGKEPGPPVKNDPARQPGQVPSVLPRRLEDPPLQERLPWQPAELVQILGDEHGRHWSPIESLVWSRDGSRLASRCTDGLRVWQALPLRELYWLKDMSGLGGLALSPDGGVLAFVHGGYQVELWELGKEAKKIRTLKQEQKDRPGVLTQIEFSEDGNALLGLISSGGVVRWQLRRESEEFAELLPPSKQPGVRVALSERGTRLAWAFRSGSDTAFHIQDVGPPPGAEQRVDEDVTGSDPQSLAFSHGGRFLAASVGGSAREGQRPGGLLLWDVAAQPAVLKSAKRNLPGGAGMVVFGRDDNTLALAGHRSVRVWTVGDGMLDNERTFQLAATPMALAFDPRGKRLAIGGDDGAIRHLVVGDQGAAEGLTKTLPPRFLSFSPDGRWLASVHTQTDSLRPEADQLSRLQLWDLDKGTSRPLELKGHLSGVVFTPDSLNLALWGGTYEPGKGLGIRKGFVRTFTLALDHPRKTIDFPEPVHQVQFHKESEQITVLLRKNYSMGGAHFLIRQYDKNWQEQAEGRVNTNFLTVSPSGKEAVSRLAEDEPGVGRMDRMVFWDLSRLKEQGAREIARKDVGKGSGGFALLFQEYFPDGKRLALAPESSRVELWDMEIRKKLFGTEILGRSLSPLAVSASGNRLAAVQHNRVNVWAVSGTELKRLHEGWEFPGPVHAVALHPTGTILATANSNGVIYLLRLPTPPSSRDPPTVRRRRSDEPRARARV